MANIEMGKTIINRIRTGDAVVASVDVHGSEVATQLRALLSELSALELTPSQIEPFIKALSALLHAATQDLEHKERQYLAELADDVEPRSLRDEKTTESVELLQRARELINAASGPNGLEKYGLLAPVSRVPREVASRLKNTIDLMVEHPMTTTDSLGTVFDSARVVDKLREAYQPLKESLDVLVKEERERQQAIEARDVAIDAWTDIYQGVAGAAAGLCKLAGRNDVAEQLKPTPARVAGRLEEPQGDISTPPDK